jgi:hypothetical protein
MQLMPQPEPPAPAIPRTLKVKLAVAFALAGVVALVVPEIDGGGEATPPLGTLLVAASLIALVTAAGLAWGIRHDLGLPARVAVYAVAYNAIVVGTKFVLGPRGLWEVNQETELTSLFPLDDKVGATLAAAFVFVLYAGAYVVIYHLCRLRLDRLPRQPRERRPAARKVLLPVLVGTLLLAGTGGIVVLVIPLLLATAGLEYLDFVFSSSVSLLVGLALAGASTLAALAFKGTMEHADAVGDAALVVAFFWLGLAFLALYHVLWVVYLLVLTAIWPLRVVIPK